MHAELTDVLADVVRVLEQNALPYSAMCGTLLGAVRHQGFIPWDDDVDLVLPRESYDRFADVYPSQCAAGFTLDLSDTCKPPAHPDTLPPRDRRQRQTDRLRRGVAHQGAAAHAGRRSVEPLNIGRKPESAMGQSSGARVGKSREASLGTRRRNFRRRGFAVGTHPVEGVPLGIATA